MFNLEKAIRPNILKLKPYSSARDEFSGAASIYLDANENAYGSATKNNHNRYPDPKHSLLRKRISVLKQIDSRSIFIANGSDEAVDLVIRIFCVPGKDKILTLHPSYAMYQVSADSHDIAVKTVNLSKDYKIDIDKIIENVDESVKVVFICNPNNPTGNTFFKPELIKLVSELEKLNKIVVIDEAYIDFCPEFSLIEELENYKNLIILQTLSKAWGLAEIRLGMAYSSKEIIDYFYKVKAPYNVNGVTQQIALEALRNTEKKDQMIASVLSERERLIIELSAISLVEKVFHSDANFIFVKVKNAELTFKELLSNGVVVRDRSNVSMCEGCLRITVGTKEENDILLQVLAGKATENEIKSTSNKDMFSAKELARISEVNRKTNETEIKVVLNLDGTGESEIYSGIGFFDHMLTQIARHGCIDMQISVKGDLEVDEHHTIEDTALSIGEAFSKALGDKKGIERYGFLLPMDESLAQVALDFSGRSHLEWSAEFKREKIGEMPTDMFQHFFKSFCETAKCNLNIKAEGQNEHHKIESIFKAFAKCIKQAIKRNPNSTSIPSSKGTL